MEFTCSRTALFSAFQLAASATPTRTTKPVLQNVKIDVTRDGLVKIVGTDSEISISSTVAGAECKGHGEILLPVARFGSLLRETTDDSIVVRVKADNIDVATSRSKYRFRWIRPDDFPDPPASTESGFLEVDAELLATMLGRTIFATDPSSTRYALGGVLLVVEGESVRAVATDGCRLSTMAGAASLIRSLPKEVEQEQTIVPVRAATLIRQVLGRSEGTAHLAVLRTAISVQTEGTYLHARLVEGRFPRWQDHVRNAREGGEVLPIAAGVLHTAIRQAAVMAEDEFRGVIFEVESGTLRIKATGTNSGESLVEVPVASHAAFCVHLDHAFLGEFLRAIPAETQLDVRATPNDGPVYFCVSSDSTVFLLMPLAKGRQ